MNNLFSHRSNRVIDEPAFVKNLLNNPRYSVVWLVVRVWLGWQWLEAASHKIGAEAWTGGGLALKGYWENAVMIPEQGRPPIAFDWYRDFIQSLLDAQAYTWFAQLVAYGELLVGIALIIGAFVGIAAFLGGLMNWNYIMAGSASTNPLLFVAAISLVLAWKVAGYIGADYFLLNFLGTPWNRSQTDTEPTPVYQTVSEAGD